MVCTRARGIDVSNHYNRATSCLRRVNCLVAGEALEGGSLARI